jgi:hypothetical protein
MNTFLDRLRDAFGAEPPATCAAFLARAADVLGSDAEAWRQLFGIYPAGQWWARLTGTDPERESWPEAAWRSYGAPLEYLATHVLGVDGVNYGFLLPAPELGREMLGFFGYYPTDGDAAFDRIAEDFPNALGAFAAGRADSLGQEQLELLRQLGIAPANHAPRYHLSQCEPFALTVPAGYVSVTTADNLPFWLRREHHDPGCDLSSTAKEDADEVIERADAVAAAGFPGTALLILRNRLHFHLTEADARGEESSVLLAMAPHYRAIGRDEYAERALAMSRPRAGHS